ncbi:hypothetical protein J5Y03_14070 [Bacillus sp. RG28]|uniref:Uncharacterized protein n=1 Tax=Gottfriedia endophytica TaxID=2820819 RepID=A0A940NWK4_9BACI|nr:hypothetical protein [Gottfriedia endophytica]MBP0726283.1 hypothetical protein [Gottfriedia endophytica]
MGLTKTIIRSFLSGIITLFIFILVFTLNDNLSWFKFHEHVTTWFLWLPFCLFAPIWAIFVDFITRHFHFTKLWQKFLLYNLGSIVFWLVTSLVSIIFNHDGHFSIKVVDLIIIFFILIISFFCSSFFYLVNSFQHTFLHSILGYAIFCLLLFFIFNDCTVTKNWTQTKKPNGLTIQFDYFNGEKAIALPIKKKLVLKVDWNLQNQGGYGVSMETKWGHFIGWKEKGDKMLIENSKEKQYYLVLSGTKVSGWVNITWD